MGFDIEELLVKIEKYLSCDMSIDLAIVGCGDLGSAIAGYQGLSRYRLNFVALFDNDPLKIGKTVKGKKVFSIERIGEICKKKGIRIAALTVPDRAAQKVADMLVGAGVRGIWNFSSCVLNVPREVIVQQQNMSGSFFVMLNKIDSI